MPLSYDGERTSVCGSVGEIILQSSSTSSQVRDWFMPHTMFFLLNAAPHYYHRTVVL